MRQAAALAERLRALTAAQTVDGLPAVTCSFGVAQYKDGDDVDRLLNRADERLYQAKREGRNRVVAG
jgi:diguanylate cyclase (GGDEF)-like protein